VKQITDIFLNLSNLPFLNLSKVSLAYTREKFPYSTISYNAISYSA